MQVFHYGEQSVTAAMEEVAPDPWAGKGYRPDIAGRSGQLCQKPGYTH